MSKVKIGILGGGFIAKVHVENLKKDGRVEIVGVVDLYLEKAQTLAKEAGSQAKAFGSLEELRSLGVDVIYVTTPNTLHVEPVLKCLESNLHVFSEKPMATSLSDAQRIKEAAAKSKGIYNLGMNMRYGHVFKKVKDVINSGGFTPYMAQVKLNDAAGDTAKQVGQVENFLAQGMDAVVILPVDTTATGPMTKAIVKAGKPLVYVNRKPEKLPKGVEYVGSKSIDAGVMNMEELGKAMGGKGNLAILIGELSDEPAHGRTDGIKQVVKEQFPNIKVTREQTGHWKRESGKTIMEDWLASGQEIDGVAANNDEMALGALQAIKAARKIDKIPVGGTDGTHDALESMNKGELNNTVFQDPVAQGEEAVNAAYLLVKKEPNPKIVDDNVWIPYQKITKENYKSFMK